MGLLIDEAAMIMGQSKDLNGDDEAALLGFESFPLPYLQSRNSGVNLTLGANFGSGGSGFFDSTAEHFVSILIGFLSILIHV